MLVWHVNGSLSIFLLARSARTDAWTGQKAFCAVGMTCLLSRQLPHINTCRDRGALVTTCLHHGTALHGLLTSHQWSTHCLQSSDYRQGNPSLCLPSKKWLILGSDAILL